MMLYRTVTANGRNLGFEIKLMMLGIAFALTTRSRFSSRDEDQRRSYHDLGRCGHACISTRVADEAEALDSEIIGGIRLRDDIQEELEDSGLAEWKPP